MRLKFFFVFSIFFILFLINFSSSIEKGLKVSIQVVSGENQFNVIVVDPAIAVGISDTITFSGVSRGITAKTDLVSSTLNSPWPFLLRNTGTGIARVQIYYDGGQCTEPTAGTLFCHPSSKVEFWVEQASCEVGTTTSGWGCNSPTAKVISCGANGCFTTASTCSDYSGPCETEANAKLLPFTNANKKYAINDLKPLATGKNEALIHIKLTVDTLEPSGTKSATFRIVSTQA